MCTSDLFMYRIPIYLICLYELRFVFTVAFVFTTIILKLIKLPQTLLALPCRDPKVFFRNNKNCIPTNDKVFHAPEINSSTYYYIRQIFKKYIKSTFITMKIK
jgi:hypothetical protein